MAGCNLRVPRYWLLVQICRPGWATVCGAIGTEWSKDFDNCWVLVHVDDDKGTSLVDAKGNWQWILGIDESITWWMEA